MNRRTALEDRSRLLVLRVQQCFERPPDAARDQGLLDYALILALIVIIVVVALKFQQPHISNTLNTVSNNR